MQGQVCEKHCWFSWNVVVVFKRCQKTPQRNASYHNLSKPQETNSIPPKRDEKLPQTKNYQKQKRPQTTSFKTSGFKTKTALPPNELKFTTDTKPPDTRLHEKLTQNSRKESETTRLKTTKQQNYETSKQQTNKKIWDSKQQWRDAKLPLPDSKAWERHSKPPQRDAKLQEAQNSQNSKKCLTSTEP